MIVRAHQGVAFACLVLIICSLTALVDASPRFSRATPTTATSGVQRRQSDQDDPNAAHIWAEDIKRYAIPFGVVGFASHLWSYWTILCLSFTRRPYAPWKKLRGGKLDVALGVAQLVATLVLAAVNVARCHKRWPLILMTVWKMIFSTSLGVHTINAGQEASAGRFSIYFGKGPKGGSPTSKLIGIHLVFLYIAGCAVGLTGLISIENLIGYNIGVLLIPSRGSEVGRTCEIVTLAFKLAVGLPFAFCCCISCMTSCCTPGIDETPGILFILMVITSCIGFALYSDWILGVIAGDIVDNPKQNEVYYCAYFAVKQLPFLSS